MNEFYNSAGAATGYPLDLVQVTAGVPTLAQRIDGAVRSAEERLAAVKEASEILARNPDLERLLNIMQRNHF